MKERTKVIVDDTTIYEVDLALSLIHISSGYIRATGGEL